jgi:hypothetical protein
MTLPEDFSPTEHLQDTIKQVYNQEVRDFFADITSEELDISTPRSSLRTACLHQEEDTVDMTISRQLLFDTVILQRLRNDEGSATRDLNYRILRRNKPKITLHFLEDLKDVEFGYRPVTGEIAFRLMHETTTSLSKSEATNYGTKIKSIFGSTGGFVWKKGKEVCSYSDWDQGYQLQLMSRNESEGRRVVERVLEIQSHAPDWENFNLSQNGEPSQAFPTVPPSETILGKTHKLPRRRPIADVRFQFASLKLSGLPKPVILFDRSGRHAETLVKQY